MIKNRGRYVGTFPGFLCGVNLSSALQDKSARQHRMPVRLSKPWNGTMTRKKRVKHKVSSSFLSEHYDLGTLQFVPGKSLTAEWANRRILRGQGKSALGAKRVTIASLETDDLGNFHGDFKKQAFSLIKHPRFSPPQSAL